MSPIALIASSEYVRRVRSPWFIATTLLTPALAVAVLALPFVTFSLGGGDAPQTVAVLDATGVLADSVATALPPSFTAFETQAEPDALRDSVLAGRLGGFLVLAPGVLDGSARARYFSRGSGLDEMTVLGEAVREAVRAERVRRAGASPAVVALLDARVGMDQVSVSEDGDAADGALVQLLVANVLAFLIYIAVLLYGAMVMRGVIEEKSNRIVEVIASSVRPFELLMGKVLGIGAVGLTQLVGWGVLMAAAAAAVGPLLLAFAPEAAMPAAGMAAGTAGAPDLAIDPAALSAAFAPGLLVAFVAYFCGGYLLFAAVFAAIGSAVDQESDAQTLQVPVMLPIMLPMLFLPAVLSQPDAPLSVFLSLFPVSSPVLMVVRMSVTDVPAWQIAASLALLAAAFVGMIWVAARVYRVGILMTGKKATFADLWRWVRTA
ncbi:MAG TPA: ABC transporter permease [Rubricoccaceae bacterium]